MKTTKFEGFCKVEEVPGDCRTGLKIRLGLKIRHGQDVYWYYGPLSPQNRIWFCRFRWLVDETTGVNIVKPDTLEFRWPDDAVYNLAEYGKVE